MDNKLSKKEIEFLVNQMDVHNMANDFIALLNGKKLHTVSATGSGRRTKYYDSRLYYTDKLDAIGIKYNIRNDAPRGGALGNHIIIETNNLKLCYNYYFNKGKKPTRRRIAITCEFFGIKNYTIYDNMSIDVQGDVLLSYKSLTEIPLAFNTVTGNFICSYNNLTSMKGVPYCVGGVFDCSNNNLLSSLDYFPGDTENFRTSFNNGDVEAAQRVSRIQSILKKPVIQKSVIEKSRKQIEDICKQYHIENYTFNVDNSIDVDDDVILMEFDLEKIPIKFNNVTGSFNCSYNRLTSLQNAPKYVGEVFMCAVNNLTSFEGFPISVGECVVAYDNNFTSIDYLPDSDNIYEIHVELEVQDMISNYQMELERQKTINYIINS